MKRFYCTICKRIKRVRVVPSNVENQYAESPTNRVGVCSWHKSARHSSDMNQKVGVK